uniref:Uncharacterized protein n=1 Tax=Anguilla anguilla TaxID=7936 RepID=A0A0E9RY84_ANGAN
MKHETNYIGVLNTYCQKTKRVCDYKLVEKKVPLTILYLCIK